MTTNDIHTQLEEERRLIAEATGGPWASAGVQHMKNPDAGMPLVASSTGFPAICVHTTDAEFIAHARTALPVRNAQLEAVLALHSRDAVFTDMCDECSDFGTDDHPPGQHVPYPCPTVKAIQGAGK